MKVGDIYADGVLIGQIRVSLTFGDQQAALEEYPAGDDVLPAAPDQIEDRTGPSSSSHGRDLSPPKEHHLPTFRGPGKEGKHRRIKPHYIQPDDDYQKKIKHGPTFRPHLTPRGAAPPEKPKKITLEDMQVAIKGGLAGRPDRTRIAKELEGNEALTRRYAQMVVGEIYYNRATMRAKLVQAETAVNRAMKRGHSLEQALWLFGKGTDRLGGVGHGRAGYYPMTTFNHGMTEEQYKDFKTNILPQVLSGSNEARGFTGNASVDVAARQKAKGTPYFDLRGEGGDQYFDEDVGKTMPYLPGKPVGVTRLGADPNWRPPGSPADAGPPSVSGTLPSPITGTIRQGPGAARPAYGGLRAHVHQGVDIEAPVGTPVHAMGAGTVTAAHFSPGATGGIVDVQYDNGMRGRYMHLSNWSRVAVGQRVNAGQEIGLSGRSPAAPTLPHLHYEVWQGGQRLDPAVVHGWGRFGPRGEGLFGTRVSSGQVAAPTTETVPTSIQSINPDPAQPTFAQQPTRPIIPTTEADRPRIHQGQWPPGPRSSIDTPAQKLAAEEARHREYFKKVRLAGDMPTSDTDHIPARALAFINTIGQGETSFNRQQAYEERYNLPEKSPFNPYGNTNVVRYGQRGADYGYFQMNETDVAEAVKLGMRREQAGHLAGGIGVQSTREQQTAAMHEYLRRRYPAAYESFLAGGSFEAMRRATLNVAGTSGKWAALLRREVAEKEFNKLMGQASK